MIHEDAVISILKEMDEKIQKQFVQDFIDQAGDKEW